MARQIRIHRNAHPLDARASERGDHPAGAFNRRHHWRAALDRPAAFGILAAAIPPNLARPRQQCATTTVAGRRSGRDGLSRGPADNARRHDRARSRRAAQPALVGDDPRWTRPLPWLLWLKGPIGPWGFLAGARTRVCQRRRSIRDHPPGGRPPAVKRQGVDGAAGRCGRSADGIPDDPASASGGLGPLASLRAPALFRGNARRSSNRAFAGLGVFEPVARPLAASRHSHVAIDRRVSGDRSRLDLARQEIDAIDRALRPGGLVLDSVAGSLRGQCARALRLASPSSLPAQAPRDASP